MAATASPSPRVVPVPQKLKLKAPVLQDKPAAHLYRKEGNVQFVPKAFAYDKNKDTVDIEWGLPGDIFKRLVFFRGLQ